jgi:hypothetical protein
MLHYDGRQTGSGFKSRSAYNIVYTDAEEIPLKSESTATIFNRARFNGRHGNAVCTQSHPNTPPTI